MGMYSYVRAFRDPEDPEFIAKRKVYEACVEAGMDPPEMIQEYFDWEPPSEHGVTTKVDQAVSEWNDGDMREGLEVRLDRLPTGTKVIRFISSY